MTDQPAPEGMGTPPADAMGGDTPTGDTPTAAVPSAEPPPLAPLVDAAAAPPPPPPMPAAAPMAPAAPPPAVAWQAPPAAVAVKGQRTVLALIAGILLLLGGIGGGLLGLLVVVLGGSFVSSLGSNIGDIPGYNGDPAALVGGVFAFLGIVVIAYSLAYLLAGIGVIRNSTWARVLGIVVGIISGLIWLSGVSGTGGSDVPGAAGAGVFSIVLLAIHVYIVVALLFFWRTKPAA
jgi:hypothetical protein